MKGDDLKSMSIDELWKLHEAVTFELNQKIAAEKTQLEQRLHELQGRRAAFRGEGAMADDQGEGGADDHSETSGHGRPHSITTVRGMRYR